MAFGIDRPLRRAFALESFVPGESAAVYSLKRARKNSYEVRAVKNATSLPHVDVASWRTVSTRIASYAVKILGKGAPSADIEDVSSEAVARAFEAFPGGSTEEVLAEARRCVKNLASSRRRRRRKGRELLFPTTDEVTHDEIRDLDGELDRSQLINALREHFAEDEQVLALMDAMLHGESSRQELASTLGVSKDDVHNIQRRLRRGAKTVVGWNTGTAKQRQSA